MTEFQRKTYEKYRDHVLSLIPDKVDGSEGEEPLSGTDIRRICKVAAEALTEKELDALITIAPVQFKRIQVADRMFNMMMSGAEERVKKEEK